MSIRKRQIQMTWRVVRKPRRLPNKIEKQLKLLCVEETDLKCRQEAAQIAKKEAKKQLQLLFVEDSTDLKSCQEAAQIAKEEAEKQLQLLFVEDSTDLKRRQEAA